MGCAATLPPLEKEAMERAEKLDFNLPRINYKIIRVKNPSVIILHRNLEIVGVDGISLPFAVVPGKNIAYLAPGKHELIISIDTGMFVEQSTSPSAGRVSGSMKVSSKVPAQKVKIEYSFEEGKHYSLDYKMGWTKTDFIFQEITDPDTLAKIPEYIKEYNSFTEKEHVLFQENAERIEAYLLFYRQNPGLLEGKWQTGNGKAEIEFIGNRVKHLAEKVPPFSTRPALEGEFVYDQNTIITNWDKYQTVLASYTKEERPTLMSKGIAWYYILNGDTLEIKSDGLKPLLNISGIYKRVK
jgi:hypothetical protein